MVADSGLNEGDCFCVPLPGDGYGVGVVARLGAPGLVLGYFDSTRYGSIPSLDDVTFSADSSLWVNLFGDLGFLEHRWIILGTIKDWDRDAWPLLDFAHHEELTERSYRISYGGDLRNQSEQSLVGPEELVGLPEHGVAGAKFVELKLDSSFRNSRRRRSEVP